MAPLPEHRVIDELQKINVALDRQHKMMDRILAALEARPNEIAISGPVGLPSKVEPSEIKKLADDLAPGNVNRRRKGSALDSAQDAADRASE